MRENHLHKSRYLGEHMRAPVLVPKHRKFNRSQDCEVVAGPGPIPQLGPLHPKLCSVLLATSGF